MSDHPFIPKSNSKIVPPFISKPKESLEAENARLKAEVERLTVAADWKTPARKIQALEAEVERLRHLEGVASSVDFYQQENEKLNEEIERLTMIKDACKRMIKRRDKRIFELKAELAHLRASSFVTAVPVEEYEKLQAEFERLTKAEVERLRKEGEAMYPNLGPGWSHNAKEGKQP